MSLASYVNIAATFVGVHMHIIKIRKEPLRQQTNNMRKVFLTRGMFFAPKL